MECWVCLLASETDIIFGELAEFSEDEKVRFLSRHEKAVLIWQCYICHKNKYEDIQSGFLMCSACEKTFHMSCAKCVNVSDNWMCNECLD